MGASPLPTCRARLSHPGPTLRPMAKAGVSQHTYADLQALPDDHHRYELIDGELVVSAAPNLAHQRTVRRLLRLLEDACPAGLEALSAPFDWVVDDCNVYEPDVLVARVADLTERNLPRPPVLAVEVLSDFSRSRDRLRKRAAYRARRAPPLLAGRPAHPGRHRARPRRPRAGRDRGRQGRRAAGRRAAVPGHRRARRPRPLTPAGSPTPTGSPRRAEVPTLPPWPGPEFRSRP